MNKLTLNLLIAAFFGFFGIAASASAATYYVATKGLDSNAGTNTAPFRTIGKALSVIGTADGAGANNIVEVAAGTYDENLINNIPSGSSWAAPFTLRAKSGDTVILKPVTNIGYSAIYLWGASSHHSIISGFIIDGSNLLISTVIVMETNYIRLQNNEIRNTKTDNAIFLGGQFVEIIDNKIHDGTFTTTWNAEGIAHGIYMAGSDKLIEGNEFYNIVGYGMHLFPAPNRNIIRKNIVRNSATVINSWAGILVSGSDNLVYDNIVRNNGGHGIQIGFGSTNAKIYNNTITSNAEQGINIKANSTNTTAKKNILYLNTTGSISDEGGVAVVLSNNLPTNPSFVNASANDFHLQSTSPAINYGVVLSEFTTDFDGNTRVGNYDAGAFEYGGSSTPPPPPPPTCTNLWNSSLAVPASFGASFNCFTTAKELLINVLCSSSSSASVSVGNSTQTEYIYKTGYTWSNNQWTPFNYSGQTMDAGGNWFIGSASASLSSIDITQKQSVLAYICEWTGVWKCGCNDSSCNVNYWNLQQFKQ